jgi:osmotically-inducible protein OsmY
MRIILALIFGILLGAGALWLLSNRNDPRVQSASETVTNVARSARETVEDKLKSFNLRTNDIKAELDKTGRVLREKTQQAEHAIADATADARITTAIKSKLVANRDLSALSISVNTTGGIVTLSGTVATADDIGKAMLVALETDGVHQVISTLQVRPPKS